MKSSSPDQVFKATLFYGLNQSFSWNFGSETVLFPAIWKIMITYQVHHWYKPHR